MRSRFSLTALEYLSNLNNMPERLTLINIVFTLIGISLFTYSLAVQLPLLKGQHERDGKKYSAAMSK